VNPKDPAQDLDRLLMVLVDGELTPVQQLHLIALLRDDPAARKQYVEYLCLDSHLEWELSPGGKGPRGRAKALGQPVARHETRKTPAVARRLERFGLRPRLRWAAAGAVLILLVLSLHRWRSRDPGPLAVAPTGGNPPTDPMRELRAAGLAILTRAVEVVWEDGGPRLAAGSVLSKGTLRFRSGVVQLEFYNGATIVLEGPAEIDLKATDWIACRRGKLRALVPPSAHGFRVDSASIDLIDLGTEFGMQVVPDRKADVHVFDGKVELYRANPGPGQDAKWELAEGMGVRIGIAGDVTPLAVDSPGFLTPRDLEGLYLEESGRRLNAWAAHSHALANDPRVVAYFSFQGDRRPGSRVLVNENGDRARDGAIVGCEWVDGRWPGKGALEFKRSSDRVRIDVPGKFDSLTYAAWVRIDAIDNRFNSLMLTDGFESGETHWQIDNLGRLVLGIRNAWRPGEKTYRPSWFKDYTSPPVITAEKFGRWVHLATVYDHRAQRVAHYVDGAAVCSEPLAWNIILRIGEAELGNWGEVRDDDRFPIRNLCGRMDEFALFRAALSTEEIRELYHRGTGFVNSQPTE
jgi:hypothetical protein